MSCLLLIVICYILVNLCSFEWTTIAFLSTFCWYNIFKLKKKFESNICNLINFFFTLVIKWFILMDNQHSKDVQIEEMVKLLFLGFNGILHSAGGLKRGWQMFHFREILKRRKKESMGKKFWQSSYHLQQIYYLAVEKSCIIG